MHPEKRYPILKTLLKDFHWRQAMTLSLVIAAIIESKNARSLDIADKLAQWLRIRLDSALNRFYRLLRNVRVMDHKLTTRLLSLLSQKLGDRPLIAIDWTAWHDDLRMLIASVISDRRAIPVQTAAYHKTLITRSQNSRENTFLRMLSMSLKRVGLKAIILCDRGFRRASWLKLLLELKQSFVIRLMDDVHILPPNTDKTLSLSDVGLRPGKVVDLGFVNLRKDGVVVVRVIGIWQKGAKEPWWLATDMKSKVSNIVAYYDRRMAIEEQLRDTKGCRFGVKLYWTQIKTPDYLARFALLVGVAILVWTGVGIAASKTNPSLRFQHPTKGPRQSYVTIGMRAVIDFVKRFRLTASMLVRLLYKPKLRLFDWIDKAMNHPILTPTII